jgi:starch synthase (maltosyl-transferring)
MTTLRSSVKQVAAAVLAGKPGGEPVAREPGPEAIGTRRSVIIERLWPQLDGGLHPVKRIVGDQLMVTADVFADNHDLLDAELLIRADDEPDWRRAPMRVIDNDRWSGVVDLTRNRWHTYTAEAWRDHFGTWRQGLLRKVAAGVAVPSELEEGWLLLQAAARRAHDAAATDDARLLSEAVARSRRARSEAKRVAALASDEVYAAARRHADRSFATRHPELNVVVDRERARYGAWYELFPRSQGRLPGRATTLKEAEWRLPEIAKMGFQVVYLPPVHPIGRTNRKGRNNAVMAGEADIGSPYAIGSEEGGHRSVASELGGLEQFRHFREAVERSGMELALDLALQVSPDHPYVSEHPAWFRRSPDGSIKYAENPPKKYEDIYPIDFYGPDAGAREELWREFLDVVLTWVRRGVLIFRVDNPHTKPIAFWSWLIREVQREHPEVIFLSEAFTRPKMMQLLAKAGFTQSYTYFTWRETAAELREYMTELTQSEIREYFRGNLFTNTPDINPHHTDAGRPAFVIRSVLAATLSSAYGIYSGWELCESARLADREEYLDSEKYEIRVRDWDAPGNIRPLIAALNGLRAARPALQLYDNLRFEAVSGERTLFYRKALPEGERDPLTGHPYAWRDPVYVAVNCDPARAESAVLHPDLPAIGIDWKDRYRYTDLLTGRSHAGRGADLPVELDPAGEPFRIFTLARLDP